ncbi:hypothetical protein K0M31_008861 [Melipona bicolor]|uniref:Uncharacterized protein n=1 Tax=Melipona bicolor TaxID=60889 RepID=A0AA40FPZ4_9HYME|nr:hypothetical protein K0M31_008861 [Melipona bicolor]
MSKEIPGKNFTSQEILKPTAKLQQINPVNTVIGLIKKRKINATNQDTDMDMANTNAQEETWLQEIPTSNRYSIFYETDPTNTSTNFYKLK